MKKKNAKNASNPLDGFCPGGRTVVVDKRRITPAIASELLTNSEAEFHNRNVNDNNVAALSRAIVKGDWNVDGNTIKLDKRCIVYDGQHRLWAIIEANKSITSYVLFNGTRDHAVTMDQGRSRSFADWLVMNSYENTTLVQSLVNLKLRYEDNSLLTRTTHYSVPELVAEFKAHESRYIDAAHTGSKVIGCPGFVRSHMALVAFVNDNNSPVFDFIDQVKTEASGKTHPCVVLRNKLLRSRVNVSRTQPLTLLDKLVFTIKAWNAYAEGRELHNLRWVRWGGGRIKAEPVPTITVAT